MHRFSRDWELRSWDRPENEAQRVEDQVSEIGLVSHLGGETVPNEGKWRKEEGPIIKPKRSVEASSLEREIDLGGEYSFSRMTKSGIGDNREVSRSILDEFKIQQDVKMYIQLPVYDGFRRFDSPGGSDLAVISQRMYDGFEIPSWPTLKHHLFIAHIPKKLFKSLREIRMRRKKDAFDQERSFLEVAEMPISRTPKELSGKGFVDDAEEADSPHIPDTFSRYSMISCICKQQKKEQTAEKAAQAALGNWISFFGTPAISPAGSDARFGGGVGGGSQFCNERDVTVQTVSPGRRRSLGDTERRHMRYKEIINRIKDKRKIKQTPPVRVWKP